MVSGGKGGGWRAEGREVTAPASDGAGLHPQPRPREWWPLRLEGNEMQVAQGGGEGGMGVMGCIDVVADT